MPNERIDHRRLPELRFPVGRHEDGQPLGGERRENLGRAVGRSAVDDRDAVDQREVVPDRQLDDVAFVADEHASRSAHRQGSW
jgi:hypothetical protein